MQRQLRGAGVCASTRAPEHPCLTFDDAPKRVAVVLFPSALDASCRASVAAASAFRTITRAAGVASKPLGDGPGRRSRAKDLATKLTKRRFRGIGARERVVSKRFAPTDQFGVQI